MNFELQKFFIGLMDEVGLVVLGDRYAQLDGAQAWAAFLFASLLFGHLVFLLGPRRNTLNKQNQPITPVVLASARQCLASGSVGRVAGPEEKLATKMIAEMP